MKSQVHEVKERSGNRKQDDYFRFRNVGAFPGVEQLIFFVAAG